MAALIIIFDGATARSTRIVVEAPFFPGKTVDAYDDQMVKSLSPADSYLTGQIFAELFDRKIF